MTYLAESGVTFATLRVYLSGLRFTQIAAGLPHPHLGSNPWLHYVLCGVHRSRSTPSNCRLPVTPEVLQALYSCWSQPGGTYGFQDCTMLWAACCLGFFGFLRSGEFTCPSLAAFRDDMLTPRDVTVDSHQSPSVVSMQLHRSKADPFGLGVKIHLGRANHTICPVSTVLAYMAFQGQAY